MKGKLPEVVFHDMLNLTNFEVGIPTEDRLINLSLLADSGGSLSQILKILPGPCHPDNVKWRGKAISLVATKQRLLVLLIKSSLNSFGEMSCV